MYAELLGKIFLDLLLFFFYFKAYGWDGACGEEA